MDRTLSTIATRAGIPALLFFLSALALASLAWGIRPALRDSDDLMRRAEEVSLFVRGLDPYDDPDMTYPPSAPPVFTPLIAPFPPAILRAAWLGLNLLALGSVIALAIRTWGDAWPGWLRAAVGLSIVAMKPVRGGIALGQFHLIPLVLGILAVGLARKRPVLAGVCLGIALIKPTMVLPLACLAMARGWWKVLIAASLVQAAAWLFTSAWLHIDPITLGREWVTLARLQDDAGVIDLPSLIRRNWPDSARLSGPLSIGLLGLFATAFVALRERSDRPSGAGLLGPISHITGVRPGVADPAFAWFAARGWKRVGWETAAAVGIALLLIWPSHPSITGRFEAVYERAFPPLAYLALFGLIASIRGETARPDHSSAASGDLGR
ncbi:MAG: glycosyltransferase family 87 protein [Isosphaeraceae bacterium]